MEKAMINEHASIGGLIMSVSGWFCMQLAIILHWPSVAGFSSFCVIVGAIWTIISNADKAIGNIQKFINWIKRKK